MQNNNFDSEPAYQIVNVHPLPLHIEIIAELIRCLPDNNKRELVKLLQKDLSGIFEGLGRSDP